MRTKPTLYDDDSPSELQLNRRQRMRELLRLSRVADVHSRNELRESDRAS